MLVIAAVAVIALPWSLALRTLITPTPVKDAGSRATAVIWSGRVFTSALALGAHLRSQGASYAMWEARHVTASLTLEHVAARPERTAREDSTTPVTSTRAVPPQAALSSPKVTQTAPRTTRTAAASAPPGASTHSGGLRAARIVRVFLLVLPVLLLGVALAPHVVLARPPFAWVDDHERIRWFAFFSALALTLGDFVAITLN